MGVVRPRKAREREESAMASSQRTPPEPPTAPLAPKSAQRTAGYRSFAGSVRRICVDAVRKARSLLPGAESPPPNH
jgi:hypothetical protein